MLDIKFCHVLLRTCEALTERFRLIILMVRRPGYFWRHAGQTDKLLLRFTVYTYVYSSFPWNAITFTEYCLTQWISKLPGSFEIHWVRQYLVNFVDPTGPSKRNSLEDWLLMSPLILTPSHQRCYIYDKRVCIFYEEAFQELASSQSWGIIVNANTSLCLLKQILLNDLELAI